MQIIGCLAEIPYGGSSYRYKIERRARSSEATQALLFLGFALGTLLFKSSPIGATAYTEPNRVGSPRPRRTTTRTEAVDVIPCQRPPGPARLNWALHVTR
jgi:hypothetical protein